MQNNFFYKSKSHVFHIFLCFLKTKCFYVIFYCAFFDQPNKLNRKYNYVLAQQKGFKCAYLVRLFNMCFIRDKHILHFKICSHLDTAYLDLSHKFSRCNISCYLTTIINKRVRYVSVPYLKNKLVQYSKQ